MIPEGAINTVANLRSTLFNLLRDCLSLQISDFPSLWPQTSLLHLCSLLIQIRIDLLAVDYLIPQTGSKPVKGESLPLPGGHSHFLQTAPVLESHLKVKALRWDKAKSVWWLVYSYLFQVTRVHISRWIGVERWGLLTVEVIRLPCY